MISHFPYCKIWKLNCISARFWLSFHAFFPFSFGNFACHHTKPLYTFSLVILFSKPHNSVYAESISRPILSFVTVSENVKYRIYERILLGDNLFVCSCPSLYSRTFFFILFSWIHFTFFSSLFGRILFRFLIREFSTGLAIMHCVRVLLLVQNKNYFFVRVHSHFSQ